MPKGRWTIRGEILKATPHAELPQVIALDTTLNGQQLFKDEISLVEGSDEQSSMAIVDLESGEVLGVFDRFLSNKKYVSVARHEYTD